MKLMPLGLAGLLAATGAINSARADAATGAVLGGVAGGIIGHQSRETAAGIIVGAAAGAIVGQALDRDAGPRAHGRVTYVESCPPPRPVVYYHDHWHPSPFSPRPRPVVIITRPAPPPPAPVIIVTNTTSSSGASCLADEYGYTSAEYLALLKPNEFALLRQRAYGCDQNDLAAYLTDREKGNLRARAARGAVIGETT